MTTPPTRATRVRRCRFQHQCPICRGMILVGQSEGLVLGRGWCHVAGCIVQLAPMPRRAG